MASKTRRALEDFDNPHDFERLAADVLNALGYQSVEPMAPAGGSDGGTDVNFRDGDEPGIAFVTLDKNVRDKFRRDLAKHEAGEGVIALFSTVDVSPAQKKVFAQDALAKGYRLEVFDLERLRSLLDASLKELRRRYLGIDDDVSARIRADVKKLFRFPDSFPYQPKTVMESRFSDGMPGRLADMLMDRSEEELAEVPGIGSRLLSHLVAFDQFRRELAVIEEQLLARIGERATCRFRQAWVIQLQYNLSRIGGASKESIERGANFLNYGMTWDSAELSFASFAADKEIEALLTGAFEKYESLVEAVTALRNEILASR